MRRLLIVFGLLTLLATAALGALWLSLPRLSSALLRDQLAKRGITGLEIEGEALSLRGVRVARLRFRRSIGGREMEAELTGVEAFYSLRELFRRDFDHLLFRVEAAELRFPAGALPVSSLRFAGITADPGKDSLLVDGDWLPAGLPEALRSFPVAPAILLRGHSVKKAELLLPEKIHFRVSLLARDPAVLSGTVAGLVRARAGDGAGWAFLEAGLEQARFQLRGGNATAQATVTAQGKLQAQLDAEADLSAGTGTLRFRFAPLRFAQEGRSTETLFPALPLPLQLGEGEARLGGKISLRPARAGPALWAESRLELQEAGGRFGENAAFHGLSARCDYRFAAARHSLRCPAITLASLDAGVAARHVRLGLAVTRGGSSALASGTGLHAELLGGAIDASGFRLDFSATPRTLQPVRLELQGIGLPEILKLKQHEEISATGTIDGEIPLALEQAGFRVRDGQLRARGPGVLRYRPAGDGLSQANPALGLALQALANFHYSELGAKMEYDPDGVMRFSVALAGKNPDFKSGQAFRFNVNVEENILALIRSMTIADDFDRTIDRKMGESRAAPRAGERKKK